MEQAVRKQPAIQLAASSQGTPASLAWGLILAATVVIFNRQRAAGRLQPAAVVDIEQEEVLPAIGIYVSLPQAAV